MKIETGTSFSVEMGIGDLSEDEFRAKHLADMGDYMVVGSRTRVLSCKQCRERVESPSDLVRFIRSSLHFDCFKKIYSNQRHVLNKGDRTYFDRVFQMKK